MHKMIRSSSRIIGKRFNKAMVMANIPSMALAAAMLVISLVIIRNTRAPDLLYSLLFLSLYITLAYSFAVTLVISGLASRSIEGHKKYTYIEILGEQMIVSEFAGSVRENGERKDYQRLWVMNLADVEQVACKRTKIVIKAKARKIEQRADWLEYVSDENGRAVFDYWWYNNGGGEDTGSVEIRDNYFYAERYAQRIIFCSEKQKETRIRREEFRRRMLEIAGRKHNRKKKKERVFRGFEYERRF